MENKLPLIFIGNIIHCIKPFVAHTIEKGFIIVQNGKILAIDYEVTLETHRELLKIDEFDEITLSDSQILIPGLIDTHIHAAQYPNVGLGLDKPLLEWLDTYTFPLEKKFKDVHFSQKVYDSIVRKTLDNGTTTACYFATLFENTSFLLAESAIKFGQRAFVGKVNMTKCGERHVDYMETENEMVKHTCNFVEAVLNKNSNLVKPIITPRFALSLSLDDMSKLGELAKKYQLNIQSHISENIQEVEDVESLFGMSYAQVYDKANLLTDKTILAHGVHLSHSDTELLAARKTSISHCPNSNTFLQSGMCDVKRLVHAGINVGLGTDVSGGNSCSIVDVMRNAIQVSIHLNNCKSPYEHEPLNCYDAFYLATLGGAKALGIDTTTGNFEVNKDFDALILDLDVSNGPCDYLHDCEPLELLQRFIYSGDDRNIAHVYVAGKRVK